MSSTAELDADFMRRAIRLAMNGRGGVEPNPMVGCVIVKNGRVIGEGYHQKYGGPHAEPNALASCRESPAGATAYVTLEPCCHLNKQTPPCVPRLIEARLARVVVGCLDPNPAVNGKGIEMLRAAGIEAEVPFLESQAKQLIAPFIAQTQYHRPYVTLKWAQTADGKVAGPGGARLPISNAISLARMHELRARCDAIMVGIRTVMMDDPLLTARGPSETHQLTRVVLDRVLEIPLQSRLVTSARQHPLLIYCGNVRFLHERYLALESAGVEIVQVETDEHRRLSLPSILLDLGRRGMTHLMVEAGPRLQRSFLSQKLADRIWVFQSPKSLNGDPEAPNAFPINYPAIASIELDADTLTEYYNPKSPVLFASECSADFVLAQDAIGAGTMHNQ